MSTHVTLPADVNRMDETGYVWAFLDRSRVPDAVRPGAVVVAGDDDDPVVAEVIDIVEGIWRCSAARLGWSGASNDGSAPAAGAGGVMSTGRSLRAGVH